MPASCILYVGRGAFQLCDASFRSPSRRKLNAQNKVFVYCVVCGHNYVGALEAGK